MNAAELIVGPVCIDGHFLNFFVGLKQPQAAMEVLAAAYTAVLMNNKSKEMTFAAYENRLTRMTEDDWYSVAQLHFDLHLRALKSSPETWSTIRRVVETQYFFGGDSAAVLSLIRKSANIKQHVGGPLGA